MGGRFSLPARFRSARITDGGDAEEKLVVPPDKRKDLERLVELFPTLPRRTLLKVRARRARRGPGRESATLTTRKPSGR